MAMFSRRQGTSGGSDSSKLGPGRQSDHRSPEFEADAYETQKMIQVVGFSDIAIGVQFVGFANFVGIRGTGYDHNRSQFEPRGFFDLGQRLQSGLLGQMQIEKNNVRMRVIGVFLLPPQIG